MVLIKIFAYKLKRSVVVAVAKELNLAQPYKRVQHVGVVVK